MDSNVSKKTNSHNFFKLEVERELGISVKNLLHRQLLSILNSDRQKFSIQIEQKSIASILEQKISISNRKHKSTKQTDKLSNIAEINFIPIVYSCPLGLLLAANRSQTLPTTMQQIRQLMSWEREYAVPELLGSNSRFILVEIVDLGWINFYLDSQFISSWLQQSLVWHRQVIDLEANSLKQVSVELFPLQYLHARCYSLLNLGVREKLITLSPDTAWITPATAKTIPWLSDGGELSFSTTAEYNLIQQLLYIADKWLDNKQDEEWFKLTFNFAQTVTVFLANCRFLGAVRAEYQQKAIARLGLIALVQLWLQKILNEKFGVAAPKSM